VGLQFEAPGRREGGRLGQTLYRPIAKIISTQMLINFLFRELFKLIQRERNEYPSPSAQLALPWRLTQRRVIIVRISQSPIDLNRTMIAHVISFFMMSRFAQCSQDHVN
jgi:hypothetical protein